MTSRPILYERMGADGLCPSPVCWRARIALSLKGVGCERRAVRFTEADRLAAETGSRTVPVLLHNGTVIADSDAIAAHLDAAFPDTDPLMAVDAKAAGAEIDRDLGTRIGPLVAADLLRRLDPADREYFQQSREARYGKSFAELETARAGFELDLAFAIGRLEPTLDQHRYLAGDAVGWADVVAYTYLLWIGFASQRSMPELVNPVRTWFERHDTTWRTVCLSPTADPAP